MEKIIKLKPFDRLFLEDSFRWLNDPIIQKCIDSEPVSKESQGLWFNSLPYRSDYKIWGLSCEVFNIGVVGFRHITDSDAEFFCYVGEKDFWGGCGRPIMQLAEEKAKGMGLKYVWLRVLLNNLRAKAVYDNVGYKEFKKDSKFYYMKKRL